MTIVLIGSVLLGAVLGRFFKVWVLIPASAFVLAAVLVRSAAVEHGLLRPLLEFAALITSLQIGYVSGLLSHSIPRRVAAPRKILPARVLCSANSGDTGLVRMERQGELLKPRAPCVEEATSVVLVLEAGHQVVGIAHDDHVAGGLVPSPALGPEIQDVVQVDVGKQR